MSASTQVTDRSKPTLLVGGYAAVAEGAWMGAAQAADVVETSQLAGRARPGPRLTGLLTRELTVGQASAILMASFFLSALLGAVRQVLFNAQFGAGAEASAYYAAFRLPDTLFSLIAGGALSSAMIPVLVSVERSGKQSASRLTSLVLNSLLAAFAIIVLMGEVLAPAFVTHVLAPGFDHRTSDLTVALTRIMLIQPLILAVGSVAIAILNSRNQFILTALSVASHNLALIAGILATHFHPALGIYGPTFGVVGGAILQVIILLPGFLTADLHYRPILDLHDRQLRDVIALLIPNGMAVGVGYAGFIADTAFASKAPQLAALPAIHNAWMLVGLPIALFGQAIGQSVFPRLAAHAEAREWGQMRRMLLRSLGAVILLSLPALLALVLLGRPVIHVLFQHGKFGASASSLTYGVLTPYAIALPAYVTSEVVTRGPIALRDTRTPLLSNSVQLAGRIVIMALLLGALGTIAIPTAFAVMASLEALGLAGILAIKLQRRMARERVSVAGAL